MVNVSGPLFSWIDRILLTYALYNMIYRYNWTIVIVLALLVYIHYEYYGKDTTMALIPGYLLFSGTLAIAYFSAKRSWTMVRAFRRGNRASIAKEPYKNALSVIGLATSTYFLVV